MSELIEERSGGSYYTGPLHEAQKFAREDARRDGLDHVLVAEPRTDTATGRIMYVVETDHDWGSGPDAETAWRYYLGAIFGPPDDEYDDLRLRNLLGI